MPMLRPARFRLAPVLSWALFAGSISLAAQVARAGHNESSYLTPQTAQINKDIAELWQQKRLSPSRPATDYEFIRRASLDIIGRIATPEEIHQFLNDPPAHRRALLIDRLLQSPEYAKNWATVWTVWLMTRSGPEEPREQMRAWLEKQFANHDLGYDKLVTDLLTASGKNIDNGAVNFILANLGEPIPRGKQRTEGEFTMIPVTARTTRLFLGLQIQCAQCHDHPFNDQWKQQHFWGVNACFRQVERDGQPMMKAPNARPPVLELRDNPSLNAAGLVPFERRNGMVLASRPTFLHGERYSPTSGLSRRQQLAQWVVQDDQFARALVNRMWGHFFGRGLTAPGAVDDFGEHNPVTNPKLLDYLASQFKQYQYSPRELIRWICTSDAYGLSTTSNASNSKPDAEPYFSRMLLRPMTAEELFESLMTATGADAPETPMNKKKLRAQWMKNLIVNFGDDEGNEASFNGTVVQALLLMNGKEINEAISNKDRGPIVSALSHRGSTSWRAVMDDLFLATLNRHPTQAEYQEIYRKLPIRVASKDPLAAWEDLLWALINSNEFILIH